MGFHGDDCTKIMKDARKSIKKLKEKTASVIWADMGPNGRHRYMIDNKIKELLMDPNGFCNIKVWSSLKFDFDMTINSLWEDTVECPVNEGKRCAPYKKDPAAGWPPHESDPHVHDWRVFSIIVYHPDKKAKEKWDKSGREGVEAKINWLVKPGLSDIDIQIIEMEHEIKNTI